MNNKPYIWMDDLDTWFTDEDYQNLDDLLKKDMFPLYTYPVKELTNDEIRHIQAQCHLKNVGYDNFIMRFARAILRKAQEK